MCEKSSGQQLKKQMGEQEILPADDLNGVAKRKETAGAEFENSTGEPRQERPWFHSGRIKRCLSHVSFFISSFIGDRFCAHINICVLNRQRLQFI